MAHAAQNELELYQVDLKTAFLYGKLDEEILIDIPPLPNDVTDFLSSKCIQTNKKDDHNELRKQIDAMKSSNDGYAMKLNKSLYGLRQASKQWHENLKEIITKSRCKESISDPCLFIFDQNDNTR